MTGPEVPPADYRPRLPAEAARFGIGFVGCGAVVQKWHLPTYLRHGLSVVGAWDPDPDALAAARALHLDLRTYASLDALLSDPDVQVVDLATRVVGRADLIKRIVAAGRHVLAQKPLCETPEEFDRIRRCAAQSPGVRVAVNLNGRWAPQWRAATQLIGAGRIGEVTAITHLHDIAMRWTPDARRHGAHPFLLYDYMLHWLDISSVWLGPRRHYRVWAHVLSRPSALGAGQTSQVAWLNVVADESVCVAIRSVAAAQSYTGHPFLIHGTAGTLRGAVDAPGQDEHLEIETQSRRTPVELAGNWFPDGFAGTMGELLCALSEGREPEHGVARAAATQQLALAACRSAASGGTPVEVTA